jgi:hypothetical protein
MHHRLDDGGIADVVGRGFGQVLKDHVGEALVLVAGEQAAEHRIGVETRKAPPDDPRTGIDQRGRAAIADYREIQSVIGHGWTATSDSATW